CLNAPDVYMDKIAVGGGLPEGVVDLDKAPKQNLADLAKAKKVDVADLVVCILDRPRHAELIAKVREAGARIMLIGDGDVSGVIATSTGGSGIGIYMGSGGGPEGRLAAAALAAVGGQGRGRCAPSAARSRAGSCSATTTRRGAPANGASPISTANTRCWTWPRAT